MQYLVAIMIHICLQSVYGGSKLLTRPFPIKSIGISRSSDVVFLTARAQSVEFAPGNHGGKYRRIGIALMVFDWERGPWIWADVALSAKDTKYSFISVLRSLP